jgi:hypothetical protein
VLYGPDDCPVGRVAQNRFGDALNDSVKRIPGTRA